MNDTEIMARTIWGEARGEGERGMQAVANVIMNRARHPRWWGDSPADVCTKPYQFSCWDRDDPNRVKMLMVTDKDPQFRQATDIASRAVLGLLDDITGGADSYYRIGSKVPFWVASSVHTVDIGRQAFFCVELQPTTTSGSAPRIDAGTPARRPISGNSKPPSASECANETIRQPLHARSPQIARYRKNV